MAITPVSGLPEKFYVVESGQFVRMQIVRTPLSNVDEQIRTLAAEAAIVTRCIGEIGSLKVTQIASPKLMTMVVKLPFIQLSTRWAIKPPVRRGPSRLMPTFHRTADMALSLPWTPPPNMRLWFTLNFHPNSDTSGMPLWRVGDASLVCTCTDAANTATYKPQLPNIYENCKLCLGRTAADFQPDNSTSLMKVLQEAYREFNNNTWNGDLMQLNNLALIEAAFAYNAETNEQLPPPTDWHESWTRISNANLNTVPFKLLQ